MIVFTKSDLAALQANPAWKEILNRARNMMDVADSKVENEGLFNQGYFVATRKLVQMFQRMPEQMLAELEGKGGAVKMR